MENKIKEDIGSDETTVNIKKSDLGDSSVTNNIAKLGDNVNVNVVDESIDGLGDVNEKIKYVSNVKDLKTGEISKPFTVSGKKYQLVRGSKKDKTIINGVYCFDEIDENNENLIYSVEDFESKIANPMRELDEINSNKNEHNNISDFTNHINLNDLDGFKHFIVSKDSGEVKFKFKSIKEMMDSNPKLTDNEVYMGHRTLRKYRLGNYLKKDVSEDIEGSIDNDKLKSDVKRLSSLIKDKFSVALSKLDKPIEQVQFLQAMANEIGVPLNKLNTLMSSFKTIAKSEPVSENRILKKSELIESITENQRGNKIIKIKDIR